MSGTYDPKTCITAGELRAMGMEVADSVPDAAWTLRFGGRVTKTETVVDGKTIVAMETVFEAPPDDDTADYVPAFIAGWRRT